MVWDIDINYFYITASLCKIRVLPIFNVYMFVVPMEISIG